MGLKLSSAITIARGILADTSPDYRYPDADLLEYGNGALRALITLKPSLFYTEADVTCATGKALQTAGFDDIDSLVKVQSVKDGNVITRIDRSALDNFSPGWMQMTAGAAQHWMPHADDPFKFYLYPPAPSGQQVTVLYVRVPATYTADQDTGLPESLKEAVTDYIVGMAESRDDEHVNSGRAAQFLSQFSARLGVAPAKG